MKGEFIIKLRDFRYPNPGCQLLPFAITLSTYQVINAFDTKLSLKAWYVLEQFISNDIGHIEFSWNPTSSSGIFQEMKSI